uniref:Importin 4 n=1 Tax=Scleropages formosus TaxID=113540 RepID=A0A8C9U9Q3_SCLFO
MTEELEGILSRLAQPDGALVHQATAELKQAFRDPAVIPSLCSVMINSSDPQIRQSAAVMLRMRVMKHWKKIRPEHRERSAHVTLSLLYLRHSVQHSLSQLSAALVKRESPERWPTLFLLLNESTRSTDPQERQVGLLLLSKVVESNPEPFKPHYCQLLQLFSSVLEELGDPSCLYYSILTVTAITAYTGTEEMNLMRALIPKLIVALKHLIKCDQVGGPPDQASEAMEVFDELIESEVSILVPYISEIVYFCLEVTQDTSLSDSLRVKALSCISVLIRLKSKAVLKHKLLSPILQTVFPVLSTAPPPGQEDPEDRAQDEDDDEDDDNGSENPKHLAAQVIDSLALHLPPEKLFPQLMPLTEACLTSENPYERKAGLMCLAVLAEGCADHIRNKMLSSMLQTVCRSVSDNSEVVRSAALFALGQFSEHLQPQISKYSAELMPLLLGYLSGLNHSKTGHVTKAFYALENFLENLGEDIQPYLPTLMDNMLTALNHSENLKIKELAVSAIGAIANAGKELLVPYFPPVIESLKGFLTDTRDEVRSLQTQALDTLSVLARTVGHDVFGPLAAECVQLGLNLTDAVDDPDLRRCTYSLFSAVSSISPDCLHPHLPAVTTIMVLALKSTEGVTAHHEEDKQFLLMDDDDDDEKEGGECDSVLEENSENEGEDRDIVGFSVENAYIDEKEDACDALGEIAFNTGVAFLPYLESSFQQVYELRDFPHEGVRRAAFTALGYFCRAQHKVWKENPTEDNYQALQKLLSVVLSSFLEAVRQDRERHVVMAVLESMNSVLKSCEGEALRDPERLLAISQVILDVLKKKTACQDGTGADEGDDEDEQQAEYDAMLQEFAGEGIPLLAAAVPAETFSPHLRELLPLIVSKAVSLASPPNMSYVSTWQLAGELSEQLMPVLVTGAKDCDAEVRSNSVFALGALAEHAQEPWFIGYPVILGLFSSLLSKEEDPRAVDNLCAALCRMIVSSPGSVPLDQVFPVLLSHLPLKEDLEENKTVFGCLAFLYSHNPALVLSGTWEAARGDLLLLRSLSKHHSQEFEGAVMSLPEEQRSALTAVAIQL